MFGTTAADNVDGLSIPSLLPGKYENVKLVDVKSEKATKSTGDAGKHILNFVFQTTDGLVHQHTEWDILPTDNEAEKKSKSLTKRVGHIMSKFMPKDELAQANTTFEAYANWVVTKIKATAFKDVALDILVVGNVYQGKAKSGFSGYPPFIAKHGDPLQFDNNGLSANKEYELFMAKKNGGVPDGANGGQPQDNGGNSMFTTAQTTTNDF